MAQHQITPSAALARPRVVSRGELLIAGLSQRYEGSNAGMTSQWARFMPYMGHVPQQIGRVTYGVLRDAGHPGAIDYITGVEVSAFPAQASDLTQVRIPAQTYAVFWHGDHVSALAGTWQAIREHGLADANLRAARGASFERYDERFDPRTGQGGVEIWVAVEQGA